MSQALQSYNPQPVAQAHNDAELIELWLRTKASERTRAEYRRDVLQLASWHRTGALNQMRGYQTGFFLQSLRLADLQGFQEHLANSDLAPNSQRRTLNAIKSLFSFAKKIGYIQFDVAAALTLPKAKNTLAERILSESDVMKIIALEPNPRNQLLIRLLYVSAARISECVSLRWRDLQSNGDSGQVTLYGKGQKTRVVKLPKKLWEDLNSGCVSFVRIDMESDDFLFKGRTFKNRPQSHITQAQAWKIVASAAKRAGITQRVSPHWMRHAHASHALQNGASVVLVQETLGHESLQTTSKYSHARPDDSSALHLKID